MTQPANRPISIDNPERLLAVAQQIGLAGSDWHEPDNYDITAEVTGTSFDNAGFHNPYQRELNASFAEYGVTLFKDGVPVANVNLATLFAMATGHPGGAIRDDDRTVESVLEAAKTLGPAQQRWAQDELDGFNQADGADSAAPAPGPKASSVDNAQHMSTVAAQMGVSAASLALGDALERANA